MFASKSERKVHYSIRKFSIGVASVVVASLFLGGVVHAEEVGGRNTPTVTSSGQDISKKYADEVESHLKKILSEIQTQLDRKRHTKTVALINELQNIKKTYLYNLNVLKEKSELPSKIKAKLEVAFDQFKKDTLKPGEKVAEAEKKVAEAKKKAEDQKEQDRRNYPTNTYKTLELEIAESDVKVKEAELELVKEEAKESRNEEKVKQAKAKVESEKAEAIRLEEIKTDREEAKRKADAKLKEAVENNAATSEQGEPKRRVKRGVLGEPATPDKKENDAKSSDSSVAVASLFMGSVVHATEKEGSTQAATSFNRGNGSQAEQRGELDLERDKAMKAVSEYVGKMVRDAYVKSDRKRHKNTVALVNQLGNIKNRYLNEIVHSTSKSQLQELMMKSQSEVDEAVSKFEKDSFSSSSSGSSTKPETPQPENPEHQKPTTPAPDTKPSPQPEGKKPSVPDINQEKEKAKLAVATYMSKILDDIQKHHLQKEKHRQIVALIKELDELKKQALSEIDNVNTKVEIENTVHKIFADMDAVVTKFKKGLTQDTPKEPGNKKPSAPKPGMQPSPQPEVKPQLEKPKPDNSKPQADDKKPSTTNNLSKDKQPSNQASTNEKATNKPKKSLPSTGSISNLALEIAGLLTLAGATILAKKRMK